MESKGTTVRSASDEGAQSLAVGGWVGGGDVDARGVDSVFAHWEVNWVQRSVLVRVPSEILWTY